MASYYDIDDIIMEDELISTVFQIGANGVGMLDPGAERNCVEQGAKVELPFWLAHELHLRQAVAVTVPPCFNQKTRKEIQADVACVDLKSRCSYFYELGCKVAPLFTMPIRIANRKPPLLSRRWERDDQTDRRYRIEPLQTQDERADSRIRLDAIVYFLSKAIEIYLCNNSKSRKT